MIFTTTMKETLHTISQGLLLPVILGVMLLILASVASLGSFLAELFTERRKREHIPKLIAGIHEKSPAEIEAIIKTSGLLKRQKRAVLELLRYSGLPEEELSSIAKKLIAQEESRYDKIVGWTDIVARVGPMFGLMGTLIPLGPGIVALGQGDTKTLSDSMMVAFDSTVAGLASAAVCYIISKIRKRWYEAYMVSLESLMECVLEEVRRDAQEPAEV